jgi:hypothetical protein
VCSTYIIDTQYEEPWIALFRYVRVIKSHKIIFRFFFWGGGGWQVHSFKKSHPDVAFRYLATANLSSPPFWNWCQNSKLFFKRTSKAADAIKQLSMISCLFSVWVWYCLILPDIAWYCLKLFEIIWYCLLLFAFVCYCLLLFAIVCYCLLLFAIVCYCLILFYIAWYCLILLDIVWYCLILFDIVWYCLILFDIVWYCVILLDKCSPKIEWRKFV